MSWEERFDEEFAKELPINRSRVLFFIRKLLEGHEDRLRNQKGIIQNHIENERNIKSQCADELEETINKSIQLSSVTEPFLDDLIKSWRNDDTRISRKT